MRVGGNTSRLPRALLPVASAAATKPAKDTIRLSISTNVPDSGRAGHRGAGGKKKKNTTPPPRGACGHPQSATRGRPGARGRRGMGFGQPLAAHADVGRHHHAEEGAFAREGVELLWLLPGQAAAKDAPAAPEFYRHEVVIGRGEMRAGEAHEHAT